MDFTLYIDESGQFSRSKVGELGLRVVAGWWTRGTPRELQPEIHAAVRETLDWWPSDWHATEIANARKLLRAARRVDTNRLPRPVRAVVENYPRSEFPNVWEIDLRPAERAALEAEGRRLVRGCLPVSKRGGGHIALCVEEDTSPVASRYPEMLRTLVTEVALHLKVASPEPVTLHAVIAQRGAETPDRTDLSEFVEGSLEGSVGAPATVDVTTPQADPSAAGLVVADVISWSLGAHGTELRRMPASQRRAWRLAQLRAKTHGCPVGLVSGLHTHLPLMNLARSTATLRETRCALYEILRALPDGALPAAVSSALERCDGIAGGGSP